MSKKSKLITVILTILIGGLAGAIAGLFGKSILDGMLSGSISGGIVGLFFSSLPRDPEDPNLAIESFSPAGFAGGVIGSVVTKAGWIGTFISAGIGWTILGLFIPAILMAILEKEKP